MECKICGNEAMYYRHVCNDCQTSYMRRWWRAHKVVYNKRRNALRHLDKADLEYIRRGQTDIKAVEIQAKDGLIEKQGYDPGYIDCETADYIIDKYYEEPKLITV